MLRVPRAGAVREGFQNIAVILSSVMVSAVFFFVFFFSIELQRYKKKEAFCKKIPKFLC